MTTYGNIELVHEGKQISYVLSVGLDLDKKGFPKYMPSLSFYKNYGSTYDEKLIDYWDNQSYLVETLYKGVLVPWADSKIKNKESLFSIFEDIEGSSIKDLDNLKKLFDIAFSMNFFNNK